MSGVATDEARRRRARHPVLLGIGIGCYVLGAMAGLFLLAGGFGPGLLVPLGTLHGVLLILLVRRLGARESSTYASLFIVGTSLMAVYVADVARDDLTLRRRGVTVTATVVKEWRDPAQGRAARYYHYELVGPDGTKVPGPAMRPPNDRYDVGRTLTVVVDPRGELRPQTPGQADATGDLLGSGAFALAALVTVGWMTWRGSDRVPWRKLSRAVGDQRLAQEAQEKKLRAALRAYSGGRGGYVEVRPEEYPDVPRARAARIAWETGLRAEAFGNRGVWRFGETVIEEVPWD
ncbi:hypothetical protein [Streptomyces sp. NPDC058330]|uniref:hypothetical protein n=1 Tax=Streptomyces sp. NPDC058330 TaxID=3346449 RepID=UPI0036EE65B9